MNKVKFGLKNVHYAVITEGEAGAITFATPEKVPGAVNISMDPKGDPSEFYADDITYYTSTANQGYEGNVEIALVPDSMKIAVFGFKADKNGVLFEDATAHVKPVALMFEFDGDANATRHVMYNVMLNRPKIESTTKADNTEVKTETMDFTASPATDTKYVKAKVENSQAQKAQYDAFFTSVYKYVPVA